MCVPCTGPGELHKDGSTVPPLSPGDTFVARFLQLSDKLTA